VVRKRKFKRGEEGGRGGEGEGFRVVYFTYRLSRQGKDCEIRVVVDLLLRAMGVAAIKKEGGRKEERKKKEMQQGLDSSSYALEREACAPTSRRFPGASQESQEIKINGGIRKCRGKERGRCWRIGVSPRSGNAFLQGWAISSLIEFP